MLVYNDVRRLICFQTEAIACVFWSEPCKAQSQLSFVIRLQHDLNWFGRISLFSRVSPQAEDQCVACQFTCVSALRTSCVARKKTVAMVGPLQSLFGVLRVLRMSARPEVGVSLVVLLASSQPWSQRTRAHQVGKVCFVCARHLGHIRLVFNSRKLANQKPP